MGLPSHLHGVPWCFDVALMAFPWDYCIMVLSWRPEVPPWGFHHTLGAVMVLHGGDSMLRGVFMDSHGASIPALS